MVSYWFVSPWRGIDSNSNYSRVGLRFLEWNSTFVEFYFAILSPTQKLPEPRFAEIENSQKSKISKLGKVRIRKIQNSVESDFAEVRFSPSQVYTHDESLVITPSIGVNFLIVGIQTDTARIIAMGNESNFTTYRIWVVAWP